VSSPFDFLEPLVELEAKIAELEQLSESTGLNMASEVHSLRTSWLPNP